MANEKELNKIIEVDGDLYKINAVTADKVNQQLVINKVELDGSISSRDAGSLVFDGSDPEEINLVTAEGGQFIGPIRVENNNEAQINDKAVLNYHDTLDTIFKEFRNYSALYSWDNSQQVATDRFKPVIPGNAPNSISVVRGLEKDLSNFAEENWYKKYLSVYLYICTDTGNIYYGASPETGNYYEPIRIAVLSERATYAGTLEFTNNTTEAYSTTAKLAKAFDGVADRFASDEEDISTLKSTVGAIKGTGLDDDTVLKSVESLNLLGIDASNGTKLSFDASAIKNLIDWANKVETGTLKIGKAKEADSANTANSATSATSATDATNIIVDKKTKKNYAGLVDDIKNEVKKVTQENGGYIAYQAGCLTYDRSIPKDKKTITASELLDSAYEAVQAEADHLNAKLNEASLSIKNSYYRSNFNTAEENQIFISAASDKNYSPTSPKAGDIWIKYA